MNEPVRFGDVRDQGARPDAGRYRTPPAPGRQAAVLAALGIGILLLGLQIWLLTVALDLYLAGNGDDVWQIAVISGAIFVGGLFVLRHLGRVLFTARQPI